MLGATPDQVWQAARTFLVGNLRLTDIGMETVQSVVRATAASGPGVNNEVVVTFKEMHTRDQVMGAAAMLSTYMDANGRATAELRMQVPLCLQSHFRILFKFGQSLRMRHGQGTRRHIKFDDALRGLYLNVKLPGDEHWSRVSVEVARRGLNARAAIEDGEIERRLDITGPMPDRARSTSLSAQPIDTALGDPQWNQRRTST